MYAKKSSAVACRVPAIPPGAKGKRLDALPPGSPITTTARSEATETTTTTSVTRTDLLIPRAFRPVMRSAASTAASLPGTAGSAACRYAPNARAVTPGPTVLAVRNIHPAAYPHHGPSIRPPNSYVPPDLGKLEASCADDMALQNATNAARSSAIRSEGPATPAAGAMTAKIPAPRIAASPVATASNILSWGRRVGCSGPEDPADAGGPSCLDSVPSMAWCFEEAARRRIITQRRARRSGRRLCRELDAVVLLDLPEDP